ncbi:MAG TPA: TetR family transcriptional regulator C-terminal domain-containing protein [Rhizomicrobium sp.]|jgi:AcrR family transcriptional regulator|nr:TetR family transcriptional regulator C-terminal domain-containing protein [Rhizomicrobium sp.]
MPKKVDHTARREAFLAAAHRMIKKFGISGVTARAVAAEAGFTTGALVHYVDSMDQLLVEASEYSARDVRARMLEVEALDDPLAALRGVLYLALPSDADKRGNWNFFLGFWERSVHNEAVRHVTHLRYEEWIKRLSRLIQRAKQAGMLAPDLDVPVAARAAVALTDGIAIQVLRSGKSPSTQTQRQLIDCFISSWLRPTGRPHGAKAD